ncbi:unnamed protein product [Penicillium nalgiovense]|uniref:Uncharacterized protein n=1 Tax=Penicillium nalgiovense TaxID=60175 RepID=A0A9W4MSA4_PENNA|nr:unnamed protein product [Penicillium nalgiovense]CAG8061694.1 unnamed protein product [Penicillium nalgiovense]CAG8062768.1 unnamed protein product [Penicillium nalgiovense]CAG8070809.1 unnamed protein product [Penicillium nalgiovense]CAG8072136.1 unnamed protein product [Penicillium nalgiovense]
MAGEGFPLWEMIPPWGSLPIEQYLIKNWDHFSTDAPSQQRQRLIHRFLERDRTSEEFLFLDELPPRMPTREEIGLILHPWRSDDVIRRKAYYLSKDRVLVFLRTHYDPEDDGRMNEWIFETDLFEDNSRWACFNDPHMFNFGPNWQRIYEIMPEVAGFVDRTQQFAHSSGIPCFRAKGPPMKGQRGADECIEKRIKNHESENRLPDINIAAYIVIADQEAFQSGLLRLLCLDVRQNIIREVRVDQKPAEITELILQRHPIIELRG